MTTIYTKDGIIQYIQSDGTSIPADGKNRDYRKVMAQDAITPFERVEIVEPEQVPGPTTEERLAAVESVVGTNLGSVPVTLVERLTSIEQKLEEAPDDPTIQEQINALVELINGSI